MYSAVISWPIVHFVLTFAITQQWYMKQIKYVLACMKAIAETEMYMEVPKGFSPHALDDNPSSQYIHHLNITTMDKIKVQEDEINV